MTNPADHLRRKAVADRVQENATRLRVFLHHWRIPILTVARDWFPETYLLLYKGVSRFLSPNCYTNDPRWKNAMPYTPGTVVRSAMNWSKHLDCPKGLHVTPTPNHAGYWGPVVVAVYVKPECLLVPSDSTPHSAKVRCSELLVGDVISGFSRLCPRAKTRVGIWRSQQRVRR